MAVSLLDLPHEVLHNVLVNVNPQDLASLCCCWDLYRFIGSDRLLHRELYLSHFDEPSLTANGHEFAWSSQLKELVKLQKTLTSKDSSMKFSQLEAITNSVEHLLQTAATGSNSSLNVHFLTDLFKSQQNVQALLCRSRLFDWAGAESWGNLATTRFKRDITLMLNELQRSRGCNAADSGTDWVTPPPGHELEDSKMTPSEMNEHLAGAEKVVLESANPSVKKFRRLSARLHCLYGVSVDTVRKETTTSRYGLRSGTAPIHPYARSLVYDLRQHTDHTLWGPFLDDGSQIVDWEKVEAIMIILDHNMRMASDENDLYQGFLGVCDKPFLGATPRSYVSRPPDMLMQPSLPLEAQDPYNVTGTWMRVICFLDYTELYDFNFEGKQIPEDQPRQPINTDEAIRMFMIKLRITKIEPPGEDDGQALPVVHFSGKSASIRPSFDTSASSDTKGTIRLTPHGDVRWTTFTVFHGEERWRSESIQVGGVGSARGVLGFWFDKDFDEHGPAGPTSFWKIHDGIEQRKPHSPMTHFTFPMY